MRQENYWLVFNLKMWKKFRKAGVDFAQWTNKELRKAKKNKNKYIGNKNGVDCYIQFKI